MVHTYRSRELLKKFQCRFKKYILKCVKVYYCIIMSVSKKKKKNQVQ